MKKLMCLVSIVILLSANMTVLADESKDADYRRIMQEINAEYGLNLGYVEVKPEEISLNEYEDALRTIAIEQKELNDFIEQREEHPASEKSIQEYATASTTKTVSKGVWNYETLFEITATYDVDGITISDPRSISVKRLIGAIVNSINYLPNNGSPTTKIIDSGRTLTVTYYGTYTIDGYAMASNVKFYTEFYYDS